MGWGQTKHSNKTRVGQSCRAATKLVHWHLAMAVAFCLQGCEQAYVYVYVYARATNELLDTSI